MTDTPATDIESHRSADAVTAANSGGMFGLSWRKLIIIMLTMILVLLFAILIPVYWGFIHHRKHHDHKHAHEKIASHEQVSNLHTVRFVSEPATHKTVGQEGEPSITGRALRKFTKFVPYDKNGKLDYDNQQVINNHDIIRDGDVYMVIDVQSDFIEEREEDAKVILSLLLSKEDLKKIQLSTDEKVKKYIVPNDLVAKLFAAVGEKVGSTLKIQLGPSNTSAKRTDSLILNFDPQGDTGNALINKDIKIPNGSLSCPDTKRVTSNVTAQLKEYYRFATIEKKSSGKTPKFRVICSYDAHTDDHCSFFKTTDNDKTQRCHDDISNSIYAGLGKQLIPYVNTWPVHCVQGTLGHFPDPSVWSTIENSEGAEEITHFVFKGFEQDKDSYSAWGGRKVETKLDSFRHIYYESKDIKKDSVYPGFLGHHSNLLKKETLHRLFDMLQEDKSKEFKVKRIIVSGIATNFCVMRTIMDVIAYVNTLRFRDALYEQDDIEIVWHASASIGVGDKDLSSTPALRVTNLKNFLKFLGVTIAGDAQASGEDGVVFLGRDRSAGFADIPSKARQLAPAEVGNLDNIGRFAV